jgi:putative transcriptional regulator
MKLKWRLRMACAERGVWTGAELRRRLADIGYSYSAASISALLTKQPSAIKMETLSAICLALLCTPNDLFEWSEG